MGDLTLEQFNSENATTTLSGRSDSDGSFDGNMVLAVNADVLADHLVHGITAVGYGGGGAGVFGRGDTGLRGDGEHFGVHGRLAGDPSRTREEKTGVLGSCFGDELAAGVIGESDKGFGVYGETDTSAGVYGSANSTKKGFGVGVNGESYNVGVAGLGVNNVGVFGTSSGPSDIGHGVAGLSANAAGVAGTGAQFGVSGTTEAGTGVLGLSTRGVGVWGQTGDPKKEGEGGLFAGLFVGPVGVYGDLVVAGTKSAAVMHPDGSRRLLYALESPESWFEDFGEAKLTGGKAKVKVRADFAAVVASKEYHVFLTAYGDTHGLYVARRDRSSFEVREQDGGKSHVTFSYRIVARRKDVPRERMPKSTLLDTLLRKAKPPARVQAPLHLARPKRRASAPASISERGARSPRAAPGSSEGA